MGHVVIQKTIKDSEPLEAGLVWKGMVALHEYCAVLDNLCNTSFALQSLSFSFLTVKSLLYVRCNDNTDRIIQFYRFKSPRELS